MAKVKIGGDERVIQPFSAAKAMEAGALVTEILEQGNEILAGMEEFAEQHSLRNAVKVPRATAFWQNPEAAAAVPADAWEASNNVIEVPGRRPGFEEQLLAVFPSVFKVARGQILKLLALVLVDERDLEKADTDGGADGIDQLLTDEGRKLLYKAQMEELLALAQSAWQVCSDQLRSDPTALALLTRLQSLRSGQKTATSNARGSSTDSPKRTGGRAKRSSTASRGSSSEPSIASS